MDSFKFLGGIVSKNLFWKAHAPCAQSKLCACLALIYKYRYNLTRSCMLTLFFSFAYGHLNYFVSAWCKTNLWLLDSLLRCCNKILRIIFFRDSRSNCDDIYKKFGNLRMLDIHKLEVGFFVYEFFHNIFPQCFTKSFKFNSAVHQHQSRKWNNIHVPFIKKVICRQSILYNGTKIWDDTPQKFINLTI